VEVASTGKTTPTRNPWPAECRGFFGIEQSLARLPLEPGGRRTLLLLDPVVNQPVTWQLTAAQKENVQLLEGSRELLRIDAVALYPGGQAMNASAWCDEKGHILKQRLAGLQEVYRTTKEKAQSTSGRKAFDLGISTLVRVARPLLNAHHTRRVRYRVEIEAGADSAAEPVKLFAAGPTQEVKRVDGHAAEIVVRSLKPGAAPESPTTDAPSEADRQPNNYIQSDDPTIVRMAAEAAGDESDPAKIALLLESYVRRAIRSVKFSQTFATAADVARSGEGDCTEHAVLLAALARAKGIPARVAIGLVYVGGATPGFGFHMWTEMFLGGVWVPLDGTLGQGGIGAAHLKLTHSNLAGGEGFASMLPVAQVLGRLKIEVLEAE
jgi:hypothetical protein